MLSTRVESIADLMSIALQAEREAVRRYAQLAGDMRDAGNDETAALFERMAAEEREHERLLLAWMKRESITENSGIGPIRWRDSRGPGRYDDEARNPHYSTPYRALAFAVNNEEIAFRFYTQVAAEADDDTLRSYAETLAREELGHAALLRAERRLAYHAERKRGLTAARPDPRAIRDEAQLLAASIRIDRYLVDALDEIADTSPRLAALGEATLRQISDNEKALAAITAAASPATSEAGFEGFDPGDGGSKGDASIEWLGNYCDRSFLFYDAIVETAADEAVLHTAQRLASSALDRIGLLKRAG